MSQSLSLIHILDLTTGAGTETVLFEFSSCWLLYCVSVDVAVNAVIGVVVVVVVVAVNAHFFVIAFENQSLFKIVTTNLKFLEQNKMWNFQKYTK